MQKPNLVICSHNPQLFDGVRTELEHLYQIRQFDSIADSSEWLHQTHSCKLVLDSSMLSGNTDFDRKILDSLLFQLNGQLLIIVANYPCPAPFHQYIGTKAIKWVEDSDYHEIINILSQNITTTDNKETSPVVSNSKTASSTTNKQDDKKLSSKMNTNTPKLQEILSDIEVAASHDVTILLIGETGTGKTFLSRLIHEGSPRHDKPFMNVACGALPDQLIESELFGHVKGAFTSAHADKEGKFIAAGEGTILLDEIDVLGLEQQVKLLRVIETGEFEPVGSNTTYVSQARLVVASNLDLEPLVKEGKFRPDLYYRLNMLKFEIPPLRERKPDIRSLTEVFIRKMGKKHGIQINTIEAEVFSAIGEYPWPGNVRELENVIQRAVIFCKDGILKVSHLPKHIVLGNAGPANDGSTVITSNMTSRKKLEEKIAVTERDIIDQALFKNNYSRTNTAKDLGISRVTLYNKMKKHGIKN